MVFVVTAHTKGNEYFCHIATTMDLGVEWVKKFGNAWGGESCCFMIENSTIDKDTSFDTVTHIKYLTKDGEAVSLSEFINLKR